MFKVSRAEKNASKRKPNLTAMQIMALIVAALLQRQAFGQGAALDEGTFQDPSALKAIEFFRLGGPGVDKFNGAELLFDEPGEYADFECTFPGQMLQGPACDEYLNLMENGKQFGGNEHGFVAVPSPFLECIRRANSGCAAIQGVPTVWFEADPDVVPGGLPHADFATHNHLATVALTRQARDKVDQKAAGQRQFAILTSALRPVWEAKHRQCTGKELVVKNFPPREVVDITLPSGAEPEGSQYFARPASERKILLPPDTYRPTPHRQIWSKRFALPKAVVRCQTMANRMDSGAKLLNERGEAFKAAIEAKTANPLLLTAQQPSKAAAAILRLMEDLSTSGQVYTDRIDDLQNEELAGVTYYVWKGKRTTWLYIESKAKNEHEKSAGILLASPRQYTELMPFT